jgi:maleylpyruvate isomerase
VSVLGRVPPAAFNVLARRSPKLSDQPTYSTTASGTGKIDSVLSGGIVYAVFLRVVHSMKLHGYFRSSAAFRVRIALNLKGVWVEHRSHHLRKGEQRAAEYVALNPQGLVPTLELDSDGVLTQSLAIIEWLDETHPRPPLLPSDPLNRARVRAFALAISCDIHPVQNLKVLNRLRGLGVEKDAIAEWAAWVNREGLEACEVMVADQPGPFCFGAAPSLADVCLVPQLSNARRFKVDVGRFPRLLRAEDAAMALPAFANAVPDRQHDKE